MTLSASALPIAPKSLIKGLATSAARAWRASPSSGEGRSAPVVNHRLELRKVEQALALVVELRCVEEFHRELERALPRLHDLHVVAESDPIGQHGSCQTGRDALRVRARQPIQRVLQRAHLLQVHLFDERLNLIA